MRWRIGPLRVHGSAFAAMAMAAACASAPSSTGYSSPAPSSADKARWQVVFADEFDGGALDRSAWTPERSCWGGGNAERQCYTDREANIRVEDGILHLVAREERFTGPLYPEDMRPGDDSVRTQDYTSGKVRTLGLKSWKYGRFSARMKLPAGQGTWPAFWMMPSDAAYGAWPLSGEIDIMEAVNLGTPCQDCPGEVETRTSGALHFGDLAPDNTYLFLKTNGDREADPSEEWRTYTVEWAEGVVQWFVDGEIFMRLTSDDWHTAAVDGAANPYAPFDRPFYLMINNAVGGNLPEKSNGAGFDAASFPSALLVDWVRVEQCAGDIETGRACLSNAEWDGEPQGPWETLAR